MSQSTVIFGALMFAFLVYITVKTDAKTGKNVLGEYLDIVGL